MNKNNKLATFGGGCFWGVEEAFRTTFGVVNTEVGYMGGDKEDPTYEEVCTDKTGYVEVVQVEFDVEKINYEDLLNKFFTVHDPTQMNRQGPDVGIQYRSVIFYHDEGQKKLAREAKRLEALKRGKELATAIEPASKFNRAEEYHQEYLHKRGAKVCH